MNKKIVWLIKKVLMGVLFFISTFVILFLIELFFGYGSGPNTPSTFHPSLTIKEAIARFPYYFQFSFIIAIVGLIFPFKGNGKK